MDLKNAIEISNISKSYKVEKKDPNKNATIFNRTPTKTTIHNVIDNLSVIIKKGEVLGVIGRNGAGKSTFLSLIAKIMEPDSGTIEYNGKIATILELGMGFHSDMSGRENIYLKGELYGFSHAEMEKRIDKIIEYAGIDDYIDNPVRTYSSGMSARLAFAILMNIDSDILLVDEILSVGDITFSSKAREHFKKMAKSGKTIIFVSHSIDYIESMCTRVIWLDNGKIFKDGSPKTICSEYRNALNESPEIIKDLAHEGISEYQYKLAIMYRDGHNIQQDIDQYHTWLQKAAEQGYTLAQILFAEILLKTGNKEGALEYYKLAANKGNSEARLALANLEGSEVINQYRMLTLKLFKQIEEKGGAFNEYRYAGLLLKTAWTAEDKENAFKAYSKAAQDGHPLAYHQLALMYRDGVGTQRNKEEMIKNLEKACSLGVITSMVLYADMRFSGSLIPKDEGIAFKWYLEAAKRGNVSSIYKVANMYEEGIGTKANKTESKKWFDIYAKSYYFDHLTIISEYLKTDDLGSTMKPADIYPMLIESGSVSSTYNMLLQYAAGNDYTQYDYDTLLINLKKIAISGNADAMYKLGTLCYYGLGMPRNIDNAINWYSQSANLGNTWAKRKLGDIYRFGKGVPINLDKAVEYYKSAVYQNDLTALTSIISMCLSKEIDDELLYQTTMNNLKRYAESGNADACRKYGAYFYEGQGVKKDLREALIWFEQAAKLGDNWCKQKIAEIYRDNPNLNNSNINNIEWFNRIV